MQVMIGFVLYLFGLRKNSTLVAKNSSLVFIHANSEMVHNPKKPPADTGKFCSYRLKCLVCVLGISTLCKQNDNISIWTYMVNK